MNHLFSKKLLLILYFVLSLLNFAWIFFWHPVCRIESGQLWNHLEDVHPCAQGGRWLTAISLGLALIALAILFLLKKKAVLTYIFGAGAAVFNAVAILLPTSFGMICGPADMRCRTHSFPASNIMNLLSLLIMLAWLVLSMLERQKARNEAAHQRRNGS